MDTSSSTNWFRSLPKIELHAHLNGCVRDETIQKMMKAKGLELTGYELKILTTRGDRSLMECFTLFDIIHRITTDHESITQITQEVVQDFEDDGVVYLELRTTPKDRPEHNMTKQSYVEAVLKGVDKFRGDGSCGSSINVFLLLSIDRRMNTEQAMETVGCDSYVLDAMMHQCRTVYLNNPSCCFHSVVNKMLNHYTRLRLLNIIVDLAIRMKEKGVIGIDLSGNPSVGHWSSWEPALEHARKCGLKVTLHGGEVVAPEEVSTMLEFKPDRLGHMVFLTEDQEEQLMKSNIPVELCLTSNLKTRSVVSIPDHHFSRFRMAGCPVVLCTDDSGVFGTTLSHEYELAAEAFNLTELDMKSLVRRSVDMVFADEACKQRLRSCVESKLATL